jgi:hypothetical protein
MIDLSTDGEEDAAGRWRSEMSKNWRENVKKCCRARTASENVQKIVSQMSKIGGKNVKKCCRTASEYWKILKSILKMTKISQNPKMMWDRVEISESVHNIILRMTKIFF